MLTPEEYVSHSPHSETVRTLGFQTSDFSLFLDLSSVLYLCHGSLVWKDGMSCFVSLDTLYWSVGLGIVEKRPILVPIP